MRTGLVRAGLILAIGSGSAAAEPDVAPDACEVTIVRAPDDVRDEIEKWVSAEPRCGTSLEVRVVPTDGGFYIAARDDRGRLYERTVPDAQSAGVLVASWVADDSVRWAPPERERYPADSIAPSGAPGATFVARPEAPVRARPARHAPSWRWLGVSGLVRLAAGSAEHVEGNGDVEGVRVELDMLRLGSLRVGVAIAPSQSYYEDYGNNALYTWVEFEDVRGMATISRTLDRGRWYARLHGGAGVVRSKVHGNHMYLYGGSYGIASATTWSPAIESALALGGVFFRNWAVEAGPMVTWRGQRVVTPYGEVALDRGFTTSMFVGVRRRL